MSESQIPYPHGVGDDVVVTLALFSEIRPVATKEAEKASRRKKKQVYQALVPPWAPIPKAWLGSLLSPPQTSQIIPFAPQVIVWLS